MICKRFFKRDFLVGFCVLYAILLTTYTYAQTDEGDEERAYTKGNIYTNYPQFDPEGGFSFFSMGYNYFYNNTNIDWMFFDMGMGAGGYYVNPSVALLQKSLLSLELGYTFTYPYNPFAYDLMQHIGNAKIGAHLPHTIIDNDTQFGLFSTYYKADTQKRESLLFLKNTTGVSYVLLNMADIFRWDINSTFSYEYAVEHQEAFYNVQFNTILKQNHRFGEIAVKPLLAYVDAVGSSAYISNQRDFLDLTTYAMFGDVALYNGAGAVLMEYRLFLLSFLNTYQWYEDFYLAGTYNIAFLTTDPDDISQHEMKMYYGGGVGFNIFGGFPMSVQFLLDEDKNMGFSIVSTIIPRY